MSILGAVVVGGALGSAASGYLFNYTKSQYVTKINQLEKLIAKLQTHLANLQDLRRELAQFWGDDNARDTGTALDITIGDVTRAMNTAEGTLRTFKTVVDSLDGSKDTLHNAINDALGILKANDV